MSYSRDTALGTRVITALVLGVVVAYAILFLPTAMMASVLGVLWLAGAWEWAGLARLSVAGRGVYVMVFAVLMVSRLLVGSGLLLPKVTLVVALIGWCIAFAGVVSFPRPIRRNAVLLAGIVALLPGWLLLNEIHALDPLGPALTLLALALVWAADIGAYFVGRSLGHVKLAPKVSPGKTWEGVSGGVGLAVLTAWAANLWLGLPTAALIALAAATALGSVVGDLTVSMLKRNVGLKDSGHLLPGHGGVMDRIDGLVAGLPVFAGGLYLAGLLS